MSESVIVSKEIESLIDKDNVFGRDSEGSMPITIWLENCIIRSEIKTARISSTSARFEFLTTHELAQEILMLSEDPTIIIGDEDERFIEFKNCNVKSLTAIAQDDIYLCRIIIDRKT
jgi:hypothetical protein